MSCLTTYAGAMIDSMLRARFAMNGQPDQARAAALMRAPKPLMALVAIAFVTGTAWGQDNAVQQSVAQADTTASVCLIDNSSGVEDSDVHTAALLVCQALRGKGVQVGEPVYEAPDSMSIYRVGVHYLGEATLLRVRHEMPVGTIIRERQVRLASIEEVFEAAERIVNALLNEGTIESTATTENLIVEDLDLDISLWAFGLLGGIAPGENSTPAPGILLGWHYETSSFGLFADFQFANNESERGHFQFGTIAVGGRYFIRDTAISPWIGGGGAMLFATKSDAFRQDGSGIGVFGSVGIEFLRFNRNRLALELRLNVPFSKLIYSEEDEIFFDFPDFDNGEPVESDRYVLPISLSISYLRDAPWLSRWW